MVFKGKFGGSKNGGDSGWTMNNHVSQHGKQLNDQMEKKFGITLDDIEQARNFNEDALAKLFDAGIQGQNAQMLMPILAEASTQAIKGTEVYNTSIAKILNQAGSSAVAVDKASNSVTVAELKMKNSYKEMTSALAQQVVLENSRHRHQLEYQQLAGYLNLAVQLANQTFQINQTITQPDRLQQAENQRYTQESLKHLAQYGTDGIENVQRKDFQGIDTEFIKSDWSITKVAGNVAQKVKAAFGFWS